MVITMACNISSYNGPLARYVKLRVAHTPGMLGTVSPHRLQRKLLVSYPGMHHGTCVTKVPWCMSGSLTRGGGENIPGIPGACATHNFTYLVRGPCDCDYANSIVVLQLPFSLKQCVWFPCIHISNFLPGQIIGLSHTRADGAVCLEMLLKTYICQLDTTTFGEKFGLVYIPKEPKTLHAIIATARDGW